MVGLFFAAPKWLKRCYCLQKDGAALSVDCESAMEKGGLGAEGVPSHMGREILRNPALY